MPEENLIWLDTTLVLWACRSSSVYGCMAFDLKCWLKDREVKM